MSEPTPMTPEREAELRRIASNHRRIIPDAMAVPDLLAEIDRLRNDLARVAAERDGCKKVIAHADLVHSALVEEMDELRRGLEALRQPTLMVARRTGHPNSCRWHVEPPKCNCGYGPMVEALALLARTSQAPAAPEGERG